MVRIGASSGISLRIDRRHGQVGRQEGACRVDGSLHFLFSDIDVEFEVELQRDQRTAERADRCHLLQAGNLAKLLFERRGYRGSHHLRIGARIKGLNLNGRIIDLRERGNGQLLERDDADQYDARHHQ